LRRRAGARSSARWAQPPPVGVLVARSDGQQDGGGGGELAACGGEGDDDAMRLEVRLLLADYPAGAYGRWNNVASRFNARFGSEYVPNFFKDRALKPVEEWTFPAEGRGGPGGGGASRGAPGYNHPNGGGELAVAAGGAAGDDEAVLRFLADDVGLGRERAAKAVTPAGYLPLLNMSIEETLAPTVGRCRWPVTKSVLKARLLSALETKM
jgi:hypothetical protein